MEVLRDDGIDMYLVMVLRDISQSVTLNFLRKKSASKHLTFIILMIENGASVTETWLHSVFENFWNRWILNVAVIFYRHGHLHTYRYDPFVKRLFAETKIGGRHEVKIRDIFPRGILNMRRKPLRICMYHDGIRSIYANAERLMGTDGLMSNYVARSLNATRVVNWVKTYGNTSISSDICFREIVEEIDDVAMNLRFLSLETFYRRAEHSVVHSRDDLCVMVPKAEVASSFWNLFRSFQIGVWLSILCTVLFATGFCLLNYREICANNNIILQLYACVISMPFLTLKRPTSLRLFFCVWLLYGMLISVAFKGNLTGNLVERKFLPDINTIKELAESSYPLATLPRHIKHLQRYIDTKNVYGAMLQDKVVETPDLQLKYLIDNNNLSYAYLQKYHVAIFKTNSRLHTKHGRPLFHAMRQCIVPFHAVYIVPYGSPYLGFINRLVRNAQEFGFINYWNRLMNAAFRTSRRNVKRKRRNEDDDEPVVLRMHHYQATFCFLFIGLTISAVCFLFELLSLKEFRQKCKLHFKMFLTLEM